MKNHIKHKVLFRDNYSCRCCGAKDNLEIHHVISKEECDLMGVSGDLVKFIDQPDYCITLCRECHSTTFFRSKRDHLYTIEEENEFKEIVTKSKQLSACREDLKKRYSNLWDMESYRKQKRQIDNSLKDLEKRKMLIVERGKNCLSTRRQHVINVCEYHLLDVIQ